MVLDSSGLNITTADNSTNLTLTSTDADANAGPNLDLYRNSSSPADNDVVGQINWFAENDAGEKIEFAEIRVDTSDVSNGSEDARVIIQTATAGGIGTSRLEILPTESVFNQDSVDVDFRVESNGNANMLFVDGGNDRVGIGVEPAQGALTIKSAGNSYTTAALVLEDTDSTTRSYITHVNGGLFVSNNSGADQVAISSSGVLAASAGIELGSGVDFTAANTLDDYEEGTFAATFTDSGGGATYTLNSSFNELAYTKIGRQVHIQGTLVVSGVSGTANGTLQITNLPFTSAGLVDQAGKSGGCGVSIYQVQKYSSGAFPATSLGESSTTLQIVLGVVDANTYACYANTATQLYFDFTYIT
jgi:prepilin-type processing-associated H-X9-DG protein